MARLASIGDLLLILVLKLIKQRDIVDATEFKLRGKMIIKILEEFISFLHYIKNLKKKKRKIGY